MPPYIPTEADFASITATLPLSLHFPSPPESTTTFLLLFHGLGDHDPPFATFAQSLALPGVLAISVRGTAPLPLSLLPGEPEANRHFHWGDDLTLDPRTGDIDVDPGFGTAASAVMDKLVKETIIGKWGWETSDILLFGFGQGGSLALGMASQLRPSPQVVDITDGSDDAHKHTVGRACKGVLSIGGPLPQSMIPTSSTREKSQTSVLICQLSDDEVDAVKAEFRDVRVSKWKRSGISMPQDSDEVLPIMKFFADRLKGEF